MLNTVPISITGFNKLKADLEHLEKNEVPEVRQRVAEAREHGDLSENGEFIAGRERLGFLMGRVSELKGMMNRSDIVDCTKVETDEARFGTVVTLLDLDTQQKMTYQLLGPDEADSDTGSISIQSPIGRAMLGLVVGDQVTVQIPRGDRHFELIDIARSTVP
jgi:transcription elongation factor GreA